MIRTLLLGAALLSPICVSAAPADNNAAEFFEKQVRPLLATQCYSCHSRSAKPVFADLLLDSRAGLERGSDAGPVVIPGDPAESRLLKAVRGELPARMPPSGRLTDEQIAALARWVEMGAPWPEETVPPAEAASGFDLEGRRREHWAWQPVRPADPPAVRDSAWPANQVDRFLLARLEAKGLRPAAEAGRAVLLRRLSFDLTGLPPTPEEIAAFESDASPAAWQTQVDRLLASPRFAERWARHWMDLVRYSESHGSEGDPDVPEAWRYRDYLIRALDADVPYDQLIREHLAGDMLPKPRLNPTERLNESLVGVAHFRMVEHGFQPVDPWEDRVKWTDNQIEVFSKAFLGLTVSCARCHDHKFDAISQKDFYALFSTFAGARPTQVEIDEPALLATNRDALAELKPRLRSALAAAWKRAATGLPARLADPAVLREFADEVCNPASPLYPWITLHQRDPAAFQAGWREYAAQIGKEQRAAREFNARFRPGWDLRRPGDYADWVRHGTGAPSQPAPPGEFTILPADDRVLSGIYPAGAYSHLLSSKHAAVVASPRFRIETDSLSLRLSGGSFSFAQLIVENYAVPRGGIYHMRFSPQRDEMGWLRWDTSFWKGFTAYVEFATVDDATHFQLDPEQSRQNPKPERPKDGRSWFGVQQIVFHDGSAPPKEEPAAVQPLLAGAPPESVEALARHMADTLGETIAAWEAGRLTGEQAAYLDFFVRRGLLPVTLQELPGPVRELVAEYRGLEAEVPVARRAPGLIDEAAPPQPLLIRGGHKNPGEPVPARFLAALDSRPFPDPAQARLRLAEAVATPGNPLTARVFVNRLWAHLFGAGLVPTVDNFGKLGEAPSHPELLDWLAARFVEDGWSIKKTLRRMLLTRAYRMESASSPEARGQDPANRLLSHMPVKRLEAEALRDAILAISGRLDAAMFGPSIPVYYAHETGQTKGDKTKGPLDGAGRRSVYLEIRRNATNPLLEVFDFPKPATTRGERDLTNVPAQSLALLNSPFVIEQAEFWAKRLVAESEASAEARVRRMFVRALGREPTREELEGSLAFITDLARAHRVAAQDLLADPRPWRDLAHALFNLKEFLYIS